MAAENSYAHCQPPSRKYLNDQSEKFSKFVSVFLKILKVPAHEFRLHQDSVDEIIRRIHQRVNYYQFFHSKDLRQSRQAAIQAYWILRYRPLKPLTLSHWDKLYDINVYLAYYLLFGAALSESVNEYPDPVPKKVRDAVTNVIESENKNDRIRAFSEYDISKEAMMLVSDYLKTRIDAEIRCHMRS